MSSRPPKQEIASERDMAAAGRVSIWVGDISDEEEALDYIESAHGLGAQFGCVLRHSREIIVSDEPKRLRQLLEGFSSWRDFIDEAVAFGSEELVAQCAVVAYACDYSKLQFTPRAGRMRFLGVANFGHDETRG